jgi:enoyl-CoA hydratase/carnithine racemase
MDFEMITYDVNGPVGWITLNRPEAMNALHPQMAAELDAALDTAEGDDEVRALAITGAPPAFCAGADLKFVLGTLEDETRVEFQKFLEGLGRVLNRIEASPLPSIAAVNGLALAGGLELLLCCDLVLAAESAKLGDAHANYGLMPGGGSSIRLTRKIGPTRAKYLLYTGDFLPAAAFVEAGLVNQVVADDELRPTVQSLGERIAARSPLSIRRMKQLVNAADDAPLHAGLRHEIDLMLLHTHSRDLAEGLKAFKEKRQPSFSGK